MRSRWYGGTLAHARTRPVRHAFRYPACYFAIDLSELPRLGRELRLFGHNRRNIVSIRDCDYLGALDGSIEEKLRERLRHCGVAEEIARIVLLTTPRVLGHTFNPASFYYCYGRDDELVLAVAEVSNTFGEGHLYLLPPNDAGIVECSEPKAFHVSPFNDVRGNYDFRLAPLEERLDVGIRLRRDGEIVFKARLTGDSRPLDNWQLVRALLSYPAATLLTLPRILWQAFRLHYQYRLPVHEKPAPSSSRTFRSTYPPCITEFQTPRRRPRAGAAALEERP